MERRGSQESKNHTEESRKRYKERINRNNMAMVAETILEYATLCAA